MWDIIGKIIFSEHRDLFTVRLGSNLLLLRLGIPPESFAGVCLGRLIRGFLGFFMDSGVFLIDLGLDAYREGQKLKEFHDEAKKIYDKTTSGLKTEEEKIEIRKKYMEIIERMGVVGTAPRNP